MAMYSSKKKTAKRNVQQNRKQNRGVETERNIKTQSQARPSRLGAKVELHERSVERTVRRTELFSKSVHVNMIIAITKSLYSDEYTASLFTLNERFLIFAGSAVRLVYWHNA